MKKIILSIGVMALMVACGSNSNEETANVENSTEEGVQDADDKNVSFTSYALLKEYKANPDELLESLKGKTVTISDVIFLFANVYQIDSSDVVSGEAPGYMESHSDQIENHFLGYSSPETGATVMVNGDQMPIQKDVPYSLEIVGTSVGNSMTITQSESIKEGDDITRIYHTQATIEIDGDLIEGKTNSLIIKGGTITSVKNY